MKLRLWNAPEEFHNWAEGFTKLGYGASDQDSPDFLLAFVKDRQELEHYFEIMLPFLTEDQVFWMAYPKKSSKKYTTDISRDSGWAALGKYDFEAVRNVALDENWSVIRFRRIKFIKTIKRKFSLKDQ